MSDADPEITDERSGVPSEPYVLEHQIGYILRLASQRHAAIFQTHSPDGLTPRQFSVLVRIDEVGPCSQNHLGRLTAMDVATIKGVVDRLSRKGLLTLEPDPQDKRRTVIRLTRSSKLMIKKLHAVGLQISNETTAALSEDERHTLVRLLSKIS
ncbi:MAG: MarR family winged helix-turn-helix transcriptional regulator [Roseovarius sp.]